nr:hypothetical protein [Neisseria meningitidis]
MGDKTSTWTRFEIEFKAKDIVIPFEVLQNPGEYFGGAYPICERFAQKATRIHAVKEDKVISADRYLEWVKKTVRTCGKRSEIHFSRIGQSQTV